MGAAGCSALGAMGNRELLQGEGGRKRALAPWPAAVALLFLFPALSSAAVPWLCCCGGERDHSFPELILSIVLCFYIQCFP